MPTGISHSVITPAVLAQRNTSETGQQAQRSREPASTAQTANSQTVLAAPGDELVRAPEQKTGSQGVENQLAENSRATGSSGSEPAGNPAVTQPVATSSGPGTPAGNGLGENVDLIG